MMGGLVSYWTNINGMLLFLPAIIELKNTYRLFKLSGMILRSILKIIENTILIVIEVHTICTAYPALYKMP